jgi:aspartokinase
MNEHEQNLRDLAAMFAMAGLLSRGETISVPTKALMLANEYMDAREFADKEHGIVALKKSRKAKTYSGHSV